MGDTKENVNKSTNDDFVIDLIEGQKNDKKFYKIIIVLLILVILAQGLYHEYQWAQFDTIIVDSGEGGYANYIGNDGDINYGESSSTQETESGKQQ